MNKSIKFKFEIIQGDETFTSGDYVEIHFKDKDMYETCGGWINEESNSKFLVLDDELMYKNEIAYSDIEEIKSII